MRFKRLLIIMLNIIFLTGCIGQSPLYTENETEVAITTINNSTDETASIAKKENNDEVKETDNITNHNEQKEILDKKISVLAVGDIMCHSANFNAAYDNESKKYDFKGFFEYVKPYIEEADIAIANFETVTGGESRGYSSYPLFNTPDQIVEALAYSGFDTLITSNNHCLDMGKDGLIRTINVIEENNLLYTGTNPMPRERLLIQEKNGINIGILSYTYSCNGRINLLNEEEKKYMVNLMQEDLIKMDIENSKKANLDALIVYLHWGTEYQREPNKEQKELATKIFEWGADIIFASHPHVIQKSEMVKVNNKEKYIIYSMGNFISNYRREDKGERQNKILTEDGVMVLIELQKSEEHNSVFINEVRHIPTWVDKYIDNGRTIFKILPLNDEEMKEAYINDKNKEKAYNSYKNTMDIMVDYKKP